MQPASPQSHFPPTTVCPANATVEKPGELLRFSLGAGENTSGRAKMQKAAMTNRFLTADSSRVGLADSEIVVSRGGLLWQIVTSHLTQTFHSQAAFIKLTHELIEVAEQAYVTGNLNALEEVSRVLMSLPVEAARQIGLYYYALSTVRKGQIDEAQRLLETVADNGPPVYRARAIQGLGAIYHYLGQLDETLRFQLEALRAVPNKTAHGLQTALMAHFEIAIVTSIDGNHKGALSHLEGLRPLVNLVAKQRPYYFYLYCSELAIEFSEMGRIAEAEAVIEIALDSPYAAAHPNWAETRQEVEAKRTSATSSVVAITQAPQANPSLPEESETLKSETLKPVESIAFGWLISTRFYFQTAIATPGLLKPSTHRQTICNTLDRLGSCSQSRAPPLNS
jgi:tetratricopeptide (TPR) repeat protein